AHRCLRTPPRAARLGRVTLHRAARHDDTPTSQQFLDLHRGQPAIQPRLDLIMMRDQQPPPLPMPIAAMRTHRLHHHRDEHVVELLFAAVAQQTTLDRGVHVTTDRLAIQLSQSLDRPESLAAQPQPQTLTNLEHPNLPEAHRRLPVPLTEGGESTGSSTATGRP